MQCATCDAAAVIHLDYEGRALCGGHFARLVEQRFKRELRDQLETLNLEGARIAVGLSGGKDSAALTALLVEALGPDPRFEIAPICVDEGIPGYRDRSLEAARELTERLGLELTVVRHEDDHGVSTQEVAETDSDRKPCATCGVFRRSSLNKAARELGSDVVATGHNLDDHAETTLMNLLQGDLEQVLRTAPHTSSPEGLVPRITPLKGCTEREVALYGVLEDLPFHGAECPHAVDATRRTYRALVLDLLDQDPHVRHRVASLTDELKDRLDPAHDGELGSCERCGEPATGTLCRACQLSERYTTPTDIA